MEPGGKTRLTGVGDADSLHLQRLHSGCWQKQKLAQAVSINLGWLDSFRRRTV